MRHRLSLDFPLLAQSSLDAAGRRGRRSIARQVALLAAAAVTLRCCALYSAPAAWLSSGKAGGSSSDVTQQQGRREAVLQLSGGVLGAAGGVLPAEAAKRPEGVNRPELLPPTPGDKTPLIDVAKVLSERQKGIVERQIGEIEKAGNVKFRVLVQTFPNSPGAAIQDYWKIDSKTLLYVHDTGGLGPDSVVNFNVGRDVLFRRDQKVSFWRRLEGKYGNKVYIEEHGDGDTILDVVQAVHDAFIPPKEEATA
eukprot:TRINITY_DN27431_c0_g1_i1.p2 TRINITY_DN27431_c0_g1~~TRINITY_DN27431_c0_g1_i1.p2  ORF type:complete len:252 (+),score=55.31 TRINITY_DN27431_c0_g1_i1:111-866(+)